MSAGELVVREVALGEWSEERLVEGIRREHGLAEKAAVASLEHAIRVGELLLEMQTRVAPGRWMTWVKENLPFDASLAARYMRWARHREFLYAAGAKSGREAQHLLVGVPGDSAAVLRFHKSNQVWGDIEVAEARRLANEGMSARAIARETGVHPSTVSRYLNPEKALSRRRLRRRRERELRDQARVASERKMYLAAKRTGRPEPRAIDQVREIRDVFRRIEADAPKETEYRKLAGKIVVLMNEAEDKLVAAMHAGYTA